MDTTRCVTGKKMFSTKELAEEALIAVHSHYQMREGMGPVAVYKCDDCGSWHFTSKGPANPKLQSGEAQNQIAIQAEADFWERKFRK